MLPGFSRAPSLDQVLAICRGAGEKNGGIYLDNHHLTRANTPFNDIVQKIGPAIPLGVEINDGPIAPPVSVQDAIVNKRLFPGDGEWDIAAFLHAVWAVGYKATNARLHGAAGMLLVQPAWDPDTSPPVTSIGPDSFETISQ